MKKVTLAFLLILLLPYCHVFMRLKPDYSKLPAETAAKVAQEIERAIQRGDRDPQTADQPSFIVSTDTIRQAIRTRAARSELVNRLLDTGHAYETRGGLVCILHTRAYKKQVPARQKKADALVIMNENNDRWALYEGIIKANRLSPRALSALQRIFYEARRDLLHDGQKYENESGAIVVKGSESLPSQ